jgi:hypothetical protein
MKLARVPRLLLPALLALALILPATAKSAGPQHVNFSGTIADVDPNGCGITGTFAFRGVDNFWPVFDSSGNLIAFKANHEETDVLTAANGKSVQIHFADQETASATTNPAGTFTVVRNFKGLPVQLSTPNGPVLLRDAGLITFVDQFDSAGNFLSETITVDKGPHPDAESGGSLFCQVITAALS